METLGHRIQELRKSKSLSQTELANMVGISYAQISRYENKGSQPPAEILNQLSNVLGTSVDYMINGASSEKAKATLHDAKILNYFREVEALPDDEKNIVLKVIGAIIGQYKTKQAYAI